MARGLDARWVPGIGDPGLAGWFKDLARAQGWYRHRQTVQLAFIAAIGAAVLGFIGWMLWRVRAADSAARWVTDAPTRWAGAGLALLLAWVVIRAASFHHIDRHLGLSIGGLALNGWLELLCLAAIGVPALWHRHRLRLTTTTAARGAEPGR